MVAVRGQISRVQPDGGQLVSGAPFRVLRDLDRRSDRAVDVVGVEQERVAVERFRDGAEGVGFVREGFHQARVGWCRSWGCQTGARRRGSWCWRSRRYRRSGRRGTGPARGGSRTPPPGDPARRARSAPLWSRSGWRRRPCGAGRFRASCASRKGAVTRSNGSSANAISPSGIARISPVKRRLRSAVRNASLVGADRAEVDDLLVAETEVCHELQRELETGDE